MALRIWTETANTTGICLITNLDLVNSLFESYETLKTQDRRALKPLKRKQAEAKYLRQRFFSVFNIHHTVLQLVSCEDP